MERQSFGIFNFYYLQHGFPPESTIWCPDRNHSAFWSWNWHPNSQSIVHGMSRHSQTIATKAFQHNRDPGDPPWLRQNAAHILHVEWHFQLLSSSRHLCQSSHCQIREALPRHVLHRPCSGKIIPDTKSANQMYQLGWFTARESTMGWSHRRYSSSSFSSATWSWGSRFITVNRLAASSPYIHRSWRVEDRGTWYQLCSPQSYKALGHVMGYVTRSSKHIEVIPEDITAFDPS